MVSVMAILPNPEDSNEVANIVRKRLEPTWMEFVPLNVRFGIAHEVVRYFERKYNLPQLRADIAEAIASGDYEPPTDEEREELDSLGSSNA